MREEAIVKFTPIIFYIKQRLWTKCSYTRLRSLWITANMINIKVTLYCSQELFRFFFIANYTFIKLALSKYWAFLMQCVLCRTQILKDKISNPKKTRYRIIVICTSTQTISLFHWSCKWLDSFYLDSFLYRKRMVCRPQIKKENAHLEGAHWQTGLQKNSRRNLTRFIFLRNSSTARRKGNENKYKVKEGAV